MLMAQRQEGKKFLDLPFSQIKEQPTESTKPSNYNTQVPDVVKEKVEIIETNPKNNYGTIDVVTKATKEAVVVKANEENNNDDLDLSQPATTEKPRPSSTTQMIDTSSVLVTPKPLLNQVLSTKAAQAVLNRQLTMQLMPMYRIR